MRVPQRMIRGMLVGLAFGLSVAALRADERTDLSALIAAAEPPASSFDRGYSIGLDTAPEACTPRYGAASYCPIVRR